MEIPKKLKREPLERQESKFSQYSTNTGVDSDDFDYSDYYDESDDMDLPAEEEKMFQILKPQQIVDKQIEMIHKIQEIMQVSAPVARILLQNNNWDLDKLQDTYFEDSVSLFSRIGISVDEARARKSLTMTTSKSSCFMCGKLDMKSNEGHCLICHDTVNDEDRDIVCPNHLCDIIADQESIKKLISETDPGTYDVYVHRLLESYVEDNPNLKWCPAPNCGNALQCTLALASNQVRCSCGQCFCFTCQKEGHPPITCTMYAQWTKKCNDDSETANWISANTKDCPKCNSAIEKNGGCNHMNCKKCNHHFCWVCLGDFDQQTYNHACNKMTGENANMADARKSLEQYLHYYQRYTNHKNSLILEDKLREAVQSKMESLQDNSAWIDVQFLKDASDQLLEARRVLAYTYALGYYLPKDKEKSRVDLFEFLQSELEKSTERLSGLLEQEPEKIVRQEIINHTQNSKTRLANFLEGVDPNTGFDLEISEMPMGKGDSKSKEESQGESSGVVNTNINEVEDKKWTEEEDEQVQQAIMESLK